MRTRIMLFSKWVMGKLEVRGKCIDDISGILKSHHQHYLWPTHQFSYGHEFVKKAICIGQIGYLNKNWNQSFWDYKSKTKNCSEDKNCNSCFAHSPKGIMPNSQCLLNWLSCFILVYLGHVLTDYEARYGHLIPGPLNHDLVLGDKLDQSDFPTQGLK